MNTQPKILVIDDDATICKSVERVLNNKGFNVDTAFTGHDGMSKFNSNKYDAVITDIMMPDVNGMDVVEFIKHADPGANISIITGYGSNENKLKANELNVAHFVEKPLSPQMIESIVEGIEAKDEVQLEETIEVEKKSGILTALKNIALFFAAPFVALGYIIALPIVGFAMAIKLSIQILKDK